MGIISGNSRGAAGLAIDLGTANTLVAVTGEGIKLNEPSVVAIERNSNRVIAVGNEARVMMNHTPDAFYAEHPLKNGVIADYDVTEAMLSQFIRRAWQRRYPWQPKPDVIICVPCSATSVEKRAVFEAASQAGARRVFLIDEPMAAAIGAQLPITEPRGSMVIDVGGGTTEIAVISLGGIINSKSIRTAGNAMDQAIVTYLHGNMRFRIGERAAESIKIKIGSAITNFAQQGFAVEVRGKDAVYEQPKSAVISAGDVYRALQEPCLQIATSIKDTFRETNPDLLGDIIKNGILLTGGGGLLNGLDYYLSQQLGMNVITSQSAQEDVVRGCLIVLENPDILQRISIKSR